jgi:hypothetical protein
LAIYLNHVWKIWQIFWGNLTFQKIIEIATFQNFHNSAKFCTHKKVRVKSKFFWVISICKNNWNVNWKTKQILKLHKSHIYANNLLWIFKIGQTISNPRMWDM